MVDMTLMNGASLKARAHASLAHLAISSLVAAFAASVVFLLWYPTPYREISGGRELFVLVVLVDVVVGPLITFLVFDQRKPRAELVRDLAVVALLQIGALAFGLHTVAQARPAFIALEGNRLRVVRAIDIADADLARAPPELNRLPWLGPRVVATRPPRPEEKVEAIDRGLAGQDIGMRPEFWLPDTQTGPAYARAAMPIDRLRQLNAGRVAELDAAINNVFGAEQDGSNRGYLPILARRTDWSALVDSNTGRIVGYVAFEGF